MKLQQALSYLGMDPGAPMKKQTHFKRQDIYQRNKAKVWSDANFIPFNVASRDNFFDVIGKDIEFYTLDAHANLLVSAIDRIWPHPDPKDTIRNTPLCTKPQQL